MVSDCRGRAQLEGWRRPGSLSVKNGSHPPSCAQEREWDWTEADCLYAEPKRAPGSDRRPAPKGGQLGLSGTPVACVCDLKRTQATAVACACEGGQGGETGMGLHVKE